MNFQDEINKVNNLSKWIIKIRRDIHETYRGIMPI